MNVSLARVCRSGNYLAGGKRRRSMKEKNCGCSERRWLVGVGGFDGGT